MKTFAYITIALILSTLNLSAQCVNNPSLQAGQINPSPLVEGQEGQLSFSFVENLLEYDGYQHDPVKLTVCLHNITPVGGGTRAISGAFAEYFDWQYDENVNCFLATQSRTIGQQEGGRIFIDFDIVNVETCPQGKVGFKANLQPAACMNGTNLTNDDEETTYTCVEPANQVDQFGQIGNLVWNDKNADGVQDAGENGLPNVELSLHRSTDGAQVATTVTNEDGEYLFNNLIADMYYIEMHMPRSLSSYYIVTDMNMGTEGSDSDFDTQSMRSGDIEITSALPYLMVDAGLYQFNSIGNQVWLDNEDNISSIGEYDESDEGLEGIEVRLLDAATDEMLQKLYTDRDGNYVFTQVRKGSYYLEFVAPSYLEFVSPSASIGSAINSDVINVTSVNGLQVGTTDVIELVAGITNLSVDAGFQMRPVVAAESIVLEGDYNPLKESNDLTWNILSNEPVDYFIITRTQDLGETFNRIGQTAPNNAGIYEFSDENIIGGEEIFYKVIAVDIEGRQTNSDIIAIKSEMSNYNTTKFSIYPNPSTDEINIEVYTDKIGKIDISFFQPIGMLVKRTEVVTLEAGKNTININTEELPVGAYLVRMQVGNTVKLNKIIKIDY